MGYKDQYSPVAANDDSKQALIGDNEDLHDEPQTIYRPAKTAWWKYALSNIAAASAGAAVMYFIARSHQSTTQLQNTSTSTTTPTAAADLISTATSTLSQTSSASTSIPTHLTDAEAALFSVERIEGDKSEIPNMEPDTILDCGFSPEDARAKGCIYDVMMQDWVPPPCYDEVLTNMYLDEGNWTWYGDWDGNTTLSNEVMAKGEHGVAWMANSYHKAHCVFSWLKIIRALRNNRGISQELLSYDHVLHCKHGALKGADDESIGVSAPTNYAKCALYSTWLKDPIPDKHNSSMRI